MDQVPFTGGVLKMGKSERRRNRLIASLGSEKTLSKAAGKVLRRLLTQGEFPRARAREIRGVKQRRATQIIRELLYSRIARSETSYGPLRLNITTDMSAALFPTLA